MILAVNNMEVELREGTIDDVPLLLSFIRAMAAFEKLTVTAPEESLRQLSSWRRRWRACLLPFAFADGAPIAYAPYFSTFATMVGKRGLWLDDLFVTPTFRAQGIGTAFMAYLADAALRHQCGRLRWMVLDWNEIAVGLYNRLPALLGHAPHAHLSVRRAGCLHSDGDDDRGGIVRALDQLDP
jgi:GNAT superfamily N-acetyltransferase